MFQPLEKPTKKILRTPKMLSSYASFICSWFSFWDTHRGICQIRIRTSAKWSAMVTCWSQFWWLQLYVLRKPSCFHWESSEFLHYHILKRYHAAVRPGTMRWRLVTQKHCPSRTGDVLDLHHEVAISIVTGSIGHCLNAKNKINNLDSRKTGTLL